MENWTNNKEYCQDAYIEEQFRKCRIDGKVCKVNEVTSQEIANKICFCHILNSKLNAAENELTDISDAISGCEKTIEILKELKKEKELNVKQCRMNLEEQECEI